MAEQVPPQDQVFINFRGVELRYGFVSHLVKALEDHKINVFIDDYEDRGKNLEILLTRIEKSRIALAIFSRMYTNSSWCMRELAKIKECVDDGKLVAIPIFYRLEPSTVKDVKGDFGDAFRKLASGEEKERKKKWKAALKGTAELTGFPIHEKSVESKIVKQIVETVKKTLLNIPSEGSRNASVDPLEEVKAGTSPGGEKRKTFGNEQRLKELEDMLDCVKHKGTLIIGVVGMPGIGKTTLLRELYTTWRRKFSRHALIDQIHEKSKNLDLEELECLPRMLLDELSKPNSSHIQKFKTSFSQLQERKVLVVLDDVSKREQIDAFREVLDKLKEGSRVVIATNDMSLITNDLVDDTYTVRHLNHRDSLQLFEYHANPPKEDFKKLSEGFVRYARGHPLALEILGRELNKQNKDRWNSKLNKLEQSPSPNIRSVFQASYDELTSGQKHVFLDIACFRSENVDYVESLMASSDHGSVQAMKALTDKFLINTCDGQVEMHDLLYTFSRELDTKASTQYGSRQRRLWLHQGTIREGIVNELQKTMGAANVRGLFLDLSLVEGETSLDSDHFINMLDLRYLKFYNSHCPQECKTDNKINIPDGLNLPLEKVRCLHWLKFPLVELPNDFKPINLVDLKLPYSEIKRLWDGDKDTPALKWVDLNHSSKLITLSGLSKAKNLQSLNLEGCISLEYLRDVKLIALKTLTLSNCSSFKEFPLVSEKLETLYLDGTAISQLPDNIVSLERLVLLNMKDCKKLEKIPACVGELKALQKLVLSGCLMLNEFPDINKSSLSILLLDGTYVRTMPQLPSVHYLCLSRNDHITCLPSTINQLSQLTWLDLKCCKSLTSIPEFPPNLQYLDAHGCTSLKTVGKPLARIMPTMQNHCTFNFTNCGNLELSAKEEITSYAQRKCQLLSDALKHYNGGLVSEALFSTCFPGCEVPSWFSYDASGSVLERKLLPHWHDKRLSGLALCVVVSFPDGQDQISSFSVTCTFKIKAEDKSWIHFSCPVGSWTRSEGEEKEGAEKDKIESDHVFIAYISAPHTIRCLEDKNSDKCNFTEACLEFTVTGATSEIGAHNVLRCGLSLVYAKDKNKNSSQEAKYDLHVEGSFHKPQHGVIEEQRKVKKEEEILMVGERRSATPEEGLIIPCVTQTCGASLTPRKEDMVIGQAKQMVESLQGGMDMFQVDHRLLTQSFK